MLYLIGPCLDPNYNIGQCMIDEAKKLFGLNSVGTHRILLKPDANYHRYVLYFIDKINRY